MPDNIRVRLAELDDVHGIVEVYVSGVDKWYKFVDNKRIMARYDELRVDERFAHGGPWMSVETCSVHLNYILVNNQYPLVALLDDKLVVGELELYVGEEKGVLGRTSFIDVLEVHREYRRRGIGRKLVEKAVEIAVKNKCDTLSVWPDPGAVGFYRKCGFNQIAYNIVVARISLEENMPTRKHRVMRRIPRNYEWYRDKYFVSPRILSSYTAYLKQQWTYAVELGRINRVQGYIPSLKTVFIVESMWDRRDRGRIYLWTSDPRRISESLETISRLSSGKGFSELLLIADERMLEYLKTEYNVIGREKLLYMELK